MFSILLWIIIGITIAWTIAFFLANLLQCLPISINWTGLGGTLEACIDTEQMYLAQAWSDVFTDGKKNSAAANSIVAECLLVVILSLPIPSV